MYRFPGITGFVPAGSARADFAGRIPSEWFVSRAVDALSQAPAAPERSRPEMVAEAAEARRALAACVATVDAAIADVCRGLGIPNPLDEATPGRHRQAPRSHRDAPLRHDRDGDVPVDR